MTFFTYSQNNTGGHFDHDETAGIGYSVCIEAANSNEADSKAEDVGLYFDGCEKGLDCPCCGDRWYRAYGEGEPDPIQYGLPIKGGWGIPSYIHYADGRVESVA